MEGLWFARKARLRVLVDNAKQCKKAVLTLAENMSFLQT